MGQSGNRSRSWCVHSWRRSDEEVITLTLRSEYKFAKYNVQPNVYAYSQEEYQRLLAGTLLSEGRSCMSDIAAQIKNGPKRRRKY